MAHVCILYAIENQAFATKIERVLFEMQHAVSRREVDQDATAVLGVAGGEPDAMIVIWSEASIASPTLIAQARGALARRTLTPVAIGKMEPPPSFQHLWPIDLSGWTGVLDDPRWRFVTDEINLSIRRSEMGHETLALDTPAEEPEKARGISGRAVLFGGAVGLAALTISLIALAPLLFGNGGKEEPPSVAFVEASELKENITSADDSSAPTDNQADGEEPAQATEDIGADQQIPEDPIPDLMVIQSAVLEEEAEDMLAATDEDTPDALPPIEIAAAETNDSPEPALNQTVSNDEAQPIQNESIVTAELETPLAEANTIDLLTDETANDDALASATDTPPPSLKPIVVASAPDSITSATPVTAAATSTIPVATPEKDVDGLDRLIVQNTVLSENIGGYFRECVICPDMAELPGGAFMMGTPETERSRDASEIPYRTETIPYRFAIGTSEVTFEQWDACVTEGGCRGYKAADPGWGRGKRPVVNVSWEDAQSFIDWLSRKTGQDYRLPTEAEWEYAARSGATTPFSFGSGVNTKLANYNGTYRYGGPVGAYRKQTTPVASFAPNAFGLFDMHGNAWEWTADCWSANGEDAAGDCSTRVLKGGAWNTGGWRLRAGHRIPGRQQVREFDNGFRVARTLP